MGKIAKNKSLYFFTNSERRKATAPNSEYPATLRFAKITPFGRNFGYSQAVMQNKARYFQ